MHAAPHGHFHQVAVEGIGSFAVVDDHEVAEAVETARKRDRPIVHRSHRGAFCRSDVDAGPSRRLVPGGTAGAIREGLDRPGQRTAKRPDRQPHTTRRRSGVRHHGLESTLGRLELAGETGVQVTLLIDAADERIAGLDGPSRCELGRARLLLSHDELAPLTVERLPRPAERSESFLKRRELGLIARRQGGHGARGLSDSPNLAHRQQQSRVPPSSKLVDIDQSALEGGSRAVTFGFELPNTSVGGADGGCRRHDIGIRGLPLFDGDLAGELELAQLFEDRTLFEYESVSLVVQHSQTLASPLGQDTGHLARNPLLARRRAPARRQHRQQAEPEHDAHETATADATIGHDSSIGAEGPRVQSRALAGRRGRSRAFDTLGAMARALGVDLGRKRIGLAVSDPSGTLARPLTTLTLEPATQKAAVAAVAREVDRLAAEDDGLSLVVVGVPTSLNGASTPRTDETTAFMDALARVTLVPVVGEDERLTSHEADERLAERERDWKKRKLRLDAAAAAIILQGYLDRQQRPGHDDHDV